MNEQIGFWTGDFGDEYAVRNAAFDPALEDRAWRTMLRTVPEDGSCRAFLECGCNTGRNLRTLARIRAGLQLGLIEPHRESYKRAVTSVAPVFSFNGAIADCPRPDRVFDLVFTAGVLIHVHPDDLDATTSRMVGLSRRYVLIAEYFNRTPISIPYHGAGDKLFKRDFGRFLLERFQLKCLDYGFLWGREYDAGGFDDMTWWLFEKR